MSALFAVLCISFLSQDAVGNQAKVSTPKPREFALDFDGRTAAVLTKHKFPQSAVLTIDVELSAKDTSKGAVVSNADNSGIGIGFDNGFVYAASHDGEGYVIVRSKERIAKDAKVHVAAIFRQKQIELFVNGDKQGKKKLERRRKRSRYPIMIGADPDPKGRPQHHYSGRIYQVRLTSKALYSDRFAPPTELVKVPKTVGLYRCHNGVGHRLTDLSGSRKHGVIQNARWVSIQ